jgi:Kef-type K+ transport system membrane component KefB
MDLFSGITSSFDFLRTAASGSEGEPFMILLPLGLILLLSKVFSLLMGKIKVPEVVGFLLGGLLVGCIYFIPGQTILTTYTMNGIDDLAKIGVILILFSAGMGTNLKQIKAEGVASVVITSLGVIVPLGLGTLAAYLFRSFGGMVPSFLPSGVNPIYSDIYYGVILTATSVSITVATLKELGRLNSKVGTALVAAAILDDIIGVVLLSVIIALSGVKSSTGSSNPLDITTALTNLFGAAGTGWDIVILLVVMASFFAISFGFGILVHRLFDWMGKKWPHHRRIPMFSLAFCFLWSYIAEACFSIADITGAYVAGLIIANTSAEPYVDKRTDQVANLLFVPVFFASVALKMFKAFGAGGGTSTSLSVSFLIFGLVWILAGLVGKVVGAGTGSLICRFKFKDALRIGLGMMARAEVLIVTAQKGVDSLLVDTAIIPFTLGLILVSSFVTPILLKVLYKGEPPENPGTPTPPNDLANPPAPKAQ